MTTTEPVSRQARIAQGLLLAAVTALVVVFFLEHLQLMLEKEYAVDEFQYAHGAWLIEQGQVIYRDFFEHHFPFVHQLMAGVFHLVGDEDPNNLIYLRFAMLPFLFLTALAAWRVNASHGGRFGVVASLMVLLAPSLSIMAVEVRPDPLAMSLYLSALAVLYPRRWPPAVRGFLSGFLLVAALWGTLKVVYYGLAFPAALIADLVHNRRRGEGYLLAHPGAFLGGAAAAGLPIAVYLTWTSSWGPFFEWTIRWSFVHQLHYPGFFWTRNFASLFATSLWLFPLAVVGIRSTLRAKPGPTSPDWLLVASLGCALASFAWQSAAYLYSLVPFTVLLAVFAARGLVALVRGAASLESGVGVFFVALLLFGTAVEVGRARTNLARLRLTSNAAQHELFTRLAVLTRPDEPVLQIAGGQITRPSVHYFYFMEAVTRQLKNDVFAYELPRAMVEKGAIAYMPSERWPRLPDPLRRFLLDNFLPYDEGLWFWGRRYEAPPAPAALEADFWAVRTGRYFVWPLEAATGLELDGAPLQAPIVELDAGAHRLHYSGSLNELFVVWLPADGQPFPPRPDLFLPYDGGPSARE